MHPTRHSRAFTLVEVLVAVAALSLIAVGLASIFGTVRATVMGGAAVSRLSAQANQIERQLREDFEAMTRDGFFVISHEYAADGAPVASTNELGASVRPRRTDQMIFFRTGSFASARRSVVEGTTARAGVAMVYYGHGQRRAFDPTPGSLYRQPEPDDLNDVPGARLGSPTNIGSSPNPNRYAADWTLLRHAVLLAPPASGATTLPIPNSVGLNSPADVADSDVQVGLQPAASSVFRALQAVIPDALPPAGVRPGVRPRLASGIVDIATTTLDEIRAIVTSVGVQPAAVTGQEMLDTVLDGVYGPADLPTQQAWMEDAFPARLPDVGASDTGFRMRYEPAPTDFLGAVDPALSALERAVRAADQEMLSASAIAPNCTEFIVQWSFGVLDDQGQLIWHDIDNPYTADAARDLYLIPYRRADPAGGFYGQFAQHPVSVELIHGQNPPPAPPQRLMSFFGYTDPTFNPASSATSSVPWAWPRLVRVTIRLADPTDRRVEQTFQFVFNAPGNPSP